MPYRETNGIETYYEDYGNGQPLVVLHGATADHQVWAEQLQPLTEDYRVILYDLRGHGQTGGSALDRYTIETYVENLAALIAALDVDQPAVLGHSLGGMIGYVFADTCPEHLSALVTVGARTPELFSIRERVTQTVMTRVVEPLTGSERIMNAALWTQRKFFGDDSMVDIDELQQIRAAHGCEPPDLSASERSKIQKAVREYLTSSWSWQVSGTPVLMLYGENEPFIESHADYLEAQLDDCRTAEIPDASHNAQVDNPEFIRTRIREFLEETFDERERVGSTSPGQGE